MASTKKITDVSILNQINSDNLHLYVELNGSFYRVDPSVLLKKIIGEAGLRLIDDTTGKEYKIGIDNGRLYSEEA